MEEATLTLCKKRKKDFCYFSISKQLPPPPLKYFKNFICLAVLGLSGGMQTLICGM